MHSLHSLDNAIILGGDAKPMGLLDTDKRTKCCLNEINTKRLHEEVELNIYFIFFFNIYHWREISGVIVCIVHTHTDCCCC